MKIVYLPVKVLFPNWYQSVVIGLISIFWKHLKTKKSTQIVCSYTIFCYAAFVVDRVWSCVLRLRQVRMHGRKISVHGWFPRYRVECMQFSSSVRNRQQHLLEYLVWRVCIRYGYEIQCFLCLQWRDLRWWKMSLVRVFLTCVLILLRAICFWHSYDRAISTQAACEIVCDNNSQSFCRLYIASFTLWPRVFRNRLPKRTTTDGLRAVTTTDKVAVTKAMGKDNHNADSARTVVGAVSAGLVVLSLVAVSCWFVIFRNAVHSFLNDVSIIAVYLADDKTTKIFEKKAEPLTKRLVLFFAINAFQKNYGWSDRAKC